MTLDDVLETITNACSGAGRAAHKTKLRTEIMYIDHEITGRQKAFGVTMYDHVHPLSQINEDFYATTEGMTDILRPPLRVAQKEIQTMVLKQATLKEDLAAAVIKRAEAFPVKAETMKDKVSNLGKLSIMHSVETKIKAELAIVDQKIKSHKQTFGLTLYEALRDAEETRGFLPTDTTIRSIYDSTGREIQVLKTTKNQKEEELLSLKKSKTAPPPPPTVQSTTIPNLDSS